MTWTHVDEIPGGQLFFCALCGRKFTRRTYMAANTNYAEALRLATAHAWEHEESEQHRLAIAAFHGEVQPHSQSDLMMHQAFGNPLPDEKAMRRRAAQAAAASYRRSGGR